MSAKELKLVYESLRDSGDLMEMYPHLTGEWKKDKPIFKQQYEFNTDFLMESDISEEGYEF